MSTNNRFPPPSHSPRGRAAGDFFVPADRTDYLIPLFDGHLVPAVFHPDERRRIPVRGPEYGRTHSRHDGSYLQPAAGAGPCRCAYAGGEVSEPPGRIHPHGRNLLVGGTGRSRKRACRICLLRGSESGREEGRECARGGRIPQGRTALVRGLGSRQLCPFPGDSERSVLQCHAGGPPRPSLRQTGL